MIVTLHPLNVKSMHIFKDLLNHHRVDYTAIPEGERCVFQVPQSASEVMGHSDFVPFVRNVMAIKTPYQLVSRAYKATDTVVNVRGTAIGGGVPVMIAGPCSVEKLEDMRQIAKELSEMGVKLLRGGAFKPRTSPYSFQGLGVEGLKILRQVADEFGMGAVSEVLTANQMDEAEAYLDCIQIGARSMQNFELLKRAGKSKLPILLKRGPSATIEEFLLAAEYIYANGNSQIMLCERGIKTFEPMTRNTFDINAIALLKELSHLPVVADPSHGTGIRSVVLPVGLSALAAGADALIVEAHIAPDRATSDGMQTVDMTALSKLVKMLPKMKEVYDGIA